MDYKQIFNRLWKDYTTQNPAVERIYELFLEKEGKVENDHIAFRTFNDKRLNIDVLAQIFLKAGYVEKGNYIFEQKKLKAKHFEHITDTDAPLVFISELNLEDSNSIEKLIGQAEPSVRSDKERAELQALLSKILGQLPDHQRRVIILRDIEAIPYVEIAGILKCTEQAARLKVFRARNRLKKILEKVLPKRQ